jgi:hypothetical protein
MEFDEICNGMSYLTSLDWSKLYNGMLCFKPLNQSYCRYNKMVLSGTQFVGVSGQDGFLYYTQCLVCGVRPNSGFTV